MTNEELAAKMQENDADRGFFEELLETLEAEQNKPAEERNYDLINEITAALCEANGTNALIAERKTDAITRIMQDAEQFKPKQRVIRVRWLLPIACALIFVTSNILSYSVFGMNAFSAAVRITNGGIMISFKDDNPAAQSNPDRFALEMLDICQKNGFTPLVPHYLPAELTPDSEWGKVDSLDKTTNVVFSFAHKKEKVIITYTYLTDPSLELEIGIPLHSYENTTETICGVSVEFFKVNDTEYRVVFKADQVIYTIWADGLDELETRKIVYSMFS